MNIKKIQTHAGAFHADEILAIATIEHFTRKTYPIERTYNKYAITQAQADETIIVLDHGMKLNTKMLNFDHHQDGSIRSTNVLILEYFCEDPFLEMELKKTIFNYVDEVDRGKIVEFRDHNYPTINSIVRNFNGMDGGFDMALDVCRLTLKGAINSAQKVIKGRKYWEEVQVDGQIAITHSSEHIVGWQQMAENENVMCLICPNTRQENSYSIVSRNSDLFTIPKTENIGQSFCHANGFIAAYDSLDQAVNHAKSLLS